MIPRKLRVGSLRIIKPLGRGFLVTVRVNHSSEAGCASGHRQAARYLSTSDPAVAEIRRLHLYQPLVKSQEQPRDR